MHDKSFRTTNISKNIDLSKKMFETKVIELKTLSHDNINLTLKSASKVNTKILNEIPYFYSIFL